MVVKRRLLLAVVSALTLVLAAAGPMMGATKEATPRPLRQETLLRVKDMATNGPGRALSWPWAGTRAVGPAS